MTVAVPSWHGQKSTKTHFPRACAAILAGRYRVEFYREPEATQTDFGGHPRFIVTLHGKAAHECAGAGTALSWIEQEEAGRIARLRELARADRARSDAVPSSHAGRTGRGARAPGRARASATS